MLYYLIIGLATLLILLILRLYVKKMPSALNHLTNRVITEHFGKAKRELRLEDEEDDDDDEDDCDLGSLLLKVEWNEQNLQQRNILKATVVNQIQGFMGVTAANSAIASNSVFLITDTPLVEKQQVANDIVAFMRQTYWQGIINTLGKVYVVRATRKDNFEITTISDAM